MALTAVTEDATAGRKLIYCAGTVLLTLLFQGATVFLGPLGVLFNVLTPFPVALLQMVGGYFPSLVAVGIVALVLSVIGPPAMGIAYILQFGLLSLVLPCLLRRGMAWDRAAIATLGTVLFCVMIFASGYALNKGTTVGELVSGYVQAEIDTAVSIYSQADVPAEKLGELRQIMTQTAEFLLKFWPGLAVVFAGFLILLTLFLLSAVAGGRIRIPGGGFQHWKTPDNLVWFLILAGFGSTFLDGLYQVVALNFLAVLIPIYFLHGIAIMKFFFHRKSVPPFLRGVGYVFAVFFNPLPLLVAGLGVFDLWVDFRKPRVKEQ